MSIRVAMWKVGAIPTRLAEATVASELQLEDMVVAAPSILSDDWMLVGRQVDTGFGGRIDLLAIDPDGALVLIELKRDRTPREVVAQALDYAAWAADLDLGGVRKIYSRLRPGRILEEDFRTQFGTDLDEEAVKQEHQIVIVAGSLDEATERIVSYLSKREIPINVLCFQVFACGEEQFLSRAWLIDPTLALVDSAEPSGEMKEPWNGEFYCNFGDGENRSWDEARRHGFVCAGGGVWYSKTLRLLKPGDRVWVKVPGRGFVGVARVTGTAQRSSEFRVETESGPRPALDVLTERKYHREYVDDPERCEYFVPVRWLQTVPLADAVHESGMFGKTNIVCRPTTTKWRKTVDLLKEKFPRYDQP